MKGSGSERPKGSFKARKGSLPDHSDDSRSRSRSEFTTTESSPPCSTWTDTYSPEPKSLPIDPPDGNEGEISRPTVSSERVKDNVPTLVVKLPPEKPNPSEDNITFGTRRRSKSLESIVLTKNSKSNNENNNTSNGEVKSNSEKKDVQKKAKNPLKAVFAGLKNSKRILLASARPVSSASVEPSPATIKQSETAPGTGKQVETASETSKQRQSVPARNTQSEPVPGTSKQSEVYVRQSVKDRVAAQSARFNHTSKETKNKTRYKVIENHHPAAFDGDFQRTPPPAPASPDPIVRVNKHFYYLTNDGATYTKSTTNCSTEVDHTNHNRAEKDYIDAACAEELPPVKKVLFLNSSPNELESSFYSGATNIASNSNSFQLPHIGSEHQLSGYAQVPSTSGGIKNYDYGHLEIFETGRYEHINPEEDSYRSYQRFPEVERDFERRDNTLYWQLQEDRLTEQHLNHKSQQNSKPESVSCKDDYNRPLRPDPRLVKKTFVKSSNGAIRREPQQGCPPTVYNQHQHRPSRRQYSDQAELCSSTNNDYEPRRRLGQSQDRHLGQSKQQNIQADQLRSREINQPRERLPQRTVQKKQPQVTPQSKKYSDEQATTSKKYNYVTQSNKPGDRPANSFWRREFDDQIVLGSPRSAADKTDVFTKSFESNSQQFPEVEISPSLRRKQPPENVNLDEFEDSEERRSCNLFKRNPPTRRHMGRMGSLEDHERKVIIEFCHLLEKSKQLFNGLRELPQYGHKQWHSYFGRTFDVYTKLWKFQQQHRAVLDSKYGLKRWQIGEIASKIGQLYYHFYLRTSETAYLNEAFSFYYAIRGRSYYTKACKEDKCELMVKKLRYYARFIVVCLLLKKLKLVRELTKELDRQIIEYGNTYDPDDQIEWTVVVDEVKAFIQTEPIVSVMHPDNYAVLLCHRLTPMTTPPVERTQQMSLSLQEVLIVGSSSQQVKFSELTMDMFRMLQTLEREPTGEIQHMYDDSPRQRFNLTPSALNNKGYNLETGAPRSDNPHKYLLFKPLPSQILVYLASGCNDLPPNGVLLLYISADGQIVQPSKHPEDGYDIGGLITTSKNDLYRDGNKDKSSQAKNRELQCFHPGDLYPFTRRPLFIIIDSDNSVVFQNIPRHFGQPMVILMSPVEMPSGLHITQSERKQQGSLFTLFLHSPLIAMCYCVDVHSVPLLHWDRAQSLVDTFLSEASQIVTRGRIDPMFLNFLGDDFLRLLILRYIFCELFSRMHRAFRTRTQRPRSAPGIPDEIIEHPALVHLIFDLAVHLQVRPSFQEPNGNIERTSKE